MLVNFTKAFNTKHCRLFIDTPSTLCAYYFTNDVCACPVSSDFVAQQSSPPGSSVHGISQAQTLEWIAVASSRGSW